MIAFNQDFLKRQANREELGTVVMQQASTIKQVAQSYVRMNRLSEVASQIGDLDYRVISADGVVRLVMSAVGLEDEFGINGNFAAFDANGVVTFYVDADDGKIYAGGGDVIIDQFGLFIKNSTTSGLQFEDSAGGRDKIHIVADASNDFEFVNIATLGTISFFMKNDAGTTERVIHIAQHASIADAFTIAFEHSTERGGRVAFGADHFIDFLQSDGTGSATVWFNERGHDIDFVIKDINNAVAFKVDASTSQVLVHGNEVSTLVGAHGVGGTVPASTTHYLAPFVTGLQSVSYTTICKAGTAKKLSVRLVSAQPASGSLVCTLFVNGVGTALTITIPAGSALGTYQDTTHEVTLAATDALRWNIVNNATAASGQIGAITMEIT